ncbi:MAG: hypothetical protein KDA84_15525 [Planctomycetaceae bacterium]|nr:hypothetical protein [Planctomycetaceae bacterium]
MSNARNKLNAAAIHGVLFVAGAVALIAQSWPVFWLLVVILIGTSFLSGDLRGRNRSGKR